MNSIQKVAIITGSSKGIGLEMALQFLKAGYKVSLVARSFSNQNFLESYKGQYLLIEADLTRTESAALVVRQTKDQWGRVDVLINNCGGLGETGTIDVLSGEAWIHSFQLNFMSAVNCTREALSVMEAQKSGKVVFLSSITAVQPGSYNPHYSSMKAALINFSKHLAGIYASKGINVNCISPGNIKTEGWDDYITQKSQETGKSVQEVEIEEEKRVINTIPLGRLGSTAEVAKLALYLVSKDGGYFSGENFLIDGGKYRSI